MMKGGLGTVEDNATVVLLGGRSSFLHAAMFNDDNKGDNRF